MDKNPPKAFPKSKKPAKKPADNIEQKIEDEEKKIEGKDEQIMEKEEETVKKADNSESDDEPSRKRRKFGAKTIPGQVAPIPGGPKVCETWEETEEDDAKKAVCPEKDSEVKSGESPKADKNQHSENKAMEGGQATVASKPKTTADNLPAALAGSPTDLVWKDIMGTFGGKI